LIKKALWVSVITNVILVITVGLLSFQYLQSPKVSVSTGSLIGSWAGTCNDGAGNVVSNVISFRSDGSATVQGQNFHYHASNGVLALDSPGVKFGFSFQVHQQPLRPDSLSFQQEDAQGHTSCYYLKE
jgi:hypothetical protein